ncbi:MAG TPA: YHS domain-containing protein [Mycobacteriales bacterium]|nr:YHS domain-containing protein [Mycobacteriales bacterium]
MSTFYTFGFVDLAGFTALTDAHGDQVAAAQIARLTVLAHKATTGPTALVKVVGDAVLLAAGEPEDALRSTLELLVACNAEPEFPLARGGLHTGSAVRTGTDYFGAGVNVAARVTARAAGGELLLTTQPAHAAKRLGLLLQELGPARLRNVSEPVELFRLDVAGGQSSTDPVCRMTVERQSAAGMLTHGGHEFWFCSLQCAAAFAQHPERHAIHSPESPL